MHLGLILLLKYPRFEVESVTMKRTVERLRFTQEQIVGMLEGYQAGAVAADLRRKHGISGATFYKWRSAMIWAVRAYATIPPVPASMQPAHEGADQAFGLP